MNVKIQLTGDVKSYLTLVDSEAVPVVYAASDARDLTKKSGNTSRTLIVADTDENHATLKLIFDVNTEAGTFISKAEPCILLEGDVPIMDNAVLQITKVLKEAQNSNNERAITYEAVVKDQTADFFTAIANKELTDLKLTDLNHVYSSSNIINSFAHTVANGYKYLMPLTQGNVFSITDFRMAIYAKVYLDRIAAGAGFSINWEGYDDNETRFDKWVIPYNGDVPKISEATKELYKVEAVKSTVQSITGTAINGKPPIAAPTQVTIPTEVIDPSNSYNAGTSLYTSPLYYIGGGNISFALQVEWELVVNNTTGSTAYCVGASGMEYKPKLYLGKNASLTSAGVSNLNTLNATGSVSVVSGQSIPSGISVLASGNTLVNFAASLTTNTSTYKIAGACGTNFFSSSRWRATSLVGGSEVLVNTVLKIKSVSMVVLPSMSEIGYNQQIIASDFIPQKVKQIDFVKGIFTLANLMIEVDAFNSNVLNVKHRDKYYDDGKAVNWTKKLDKSKEQQIIFLPSLTAKKMVLTYAPDKDEPNVNYLDDTKENYGQVDFTFDSEHVKGVDTKPVIFSPTPMAKNDFNAIVPMINGVAPKTNIRLLYDGGATTCSEFKIVDYVDSSGNQIGNTSTYYPLLSHFDKEVNPMFDLNLSVCDFYYYEIGNKTNNNLFNLKWRRTLNQMNVGKMLIAYFDLNSFDISNMELSDKIQVANTWYNINKIEYNANSRATTKVELITADDSIKLPKFRIRFPKLPALGDASLGAVRSVVSKAVEFQNVILTKAKVFISGINNVVGQSVKSAVILGDGNTVGAEKVLIIGDNQEAEESGVYTPLVVFPDGTKMGSTNDVVSTNYFTGDQVQDADRTHDAAGFKVDVNDTAGLKLKGKSTQGTSDTIMTVESLRSTSSYKVFEVISAVSAIITVLADRTTKFWGRVGIGDAAQATYQVQVYGNGMDVGINVEATNSASKGMVATSSGVNGKGGSFACQASGGTGLSALGDAIGVQGTVTTNGGTAGAFTGKVLIQDYNGVAGRKACAVLDINSTTGFVVIPNMTTVQRDAVPTPKNGSVLFNITTDQYEKYSETTSTWTAW